MSVVTGYSRGYPDPTNYFAARGEWNGKVNHLYFEALLVNGNLANSRWFLGRIPSAALILPISTLHTTAITGLTSFSVGLTNEIGTTVANALVNAQTAASAANFSLVGAVATANYGRMAWQHLGLARDPGAMLTVILTANTNVGANGTINGNLYWSHAF